MNKHNDIDEFSGGVVAAGTDRVKDKLRDLARRHEVEPVEIQFIVGWYENLPLSERAVFVQATRELQDELNAD